jgi:hypothetical protein
MDWWIGFIDHLYTPLKTTAPQFTNHHSTRKYIFKPAVSTAVPSKRLLSVEIHQLPVLRSLLSSDYPLNWILVNWHLIYLCSRLTAISHQPPSLLLTGWLSADNCQLNSLTRQAATSLIWTTNWQLNCQSQSHNATDSQSESLGVKLHHALTITPWYRRHKNTSVSIVTVLLCPSLFRGNVFTA